MTNATRIGSGAARLPMAIVTGASSGIGRAIAVALAQRAYRTVLVARRRSLLDGLSAELSRYAPSRAVVLDLAETEAIAPAMARVMLEEGPARVLVNSAGFGEYGQFEEQSVGTIRRLMRVNFEAATEMTRALLPGLLEEGSRGGAAHVFNICSMSARVGPPGHAGYAASKGALRSFTEVLRAEHAGRGVIFTVVYPGIIGTEYFEKGTMRRLWPRVARYAIGAERVSGAVMAAMGRDRASVYVPRQYRVLDWIAAASPRLATWVVERGMTPCGK